MKVYHKRSNELNTDGTGPKLPTSQDIECGELAMNYHDGHEVLAIKNDNNEIVTFSPNSVIGDISKYWQNIEDSAITFDNIIDMLNFNMKCVIDFFQRKPVVLWQTDGTSGLLGVNDGTMKLDTWQLENLDFSPYRFVIAYIKQADRDFSTTQANYVTPSMMICIPLDDASKSSEYDAYIAGGNTTNPNDRNVHFCVIVAIDGTKTKFKVVSEHSIYGTALGGRNDNGRFCYKLEGYY